MMVEVQETTNNNKKRKRRNYKSNTTTTSMEDNKTTYCYLLIQYPDSYPPQSQSKNESFCKEEARLESSHDLCYYKYN